MTIDELHELRKLLEAADLPQGPFQWQQCYEMGDDCMHWALCDPANDAEGRVTDHNLILLTTLPTWSGDTPETWSQPLDTYPRLALIAALLTHARALLSRKDKGEDGEG